MKNKIILPLDNATNHLTCEEWARGYYVSTVGADEKGVRAYIQNQESEDKRLDELSLFDRIR